MNEKKYALSTQVYPCVLQQPLSDSMVLLHGWGSGSHSWQPLIPSLQNIANVITMDLPGFGESLPTDEFTLEHLLELIAAGLPKKCVLIGWSLGGMLAVQIAARYPQKISHIITLATNAKFVASSDYAAAMLRAVNRQFNKNFVSDAPATLKLFSGLLAQGDANERVLLKQVRTLSEPEKINKNWLQALELLAQLDNREAFSALQIPGLHILGERDALVPQTCALELTRLNSQQQIHVVPGAAHAIHWSGPNIVMQLIKDFVLAPELDKKHVANAFSRAAATYDSVASLQRNVGATLFKKIELNDKAKVVIDLGCGTGFFSPQLQTAFPDSLMVGVDIAEGMLRFAREQHREQAHWICSDAEKLPFANRSVDIIYSNFALQWCTDLPRLFAELRRILTTNGQLIFTTLGPATLYELKTSWQQVDNKVHVNKFHDRDLLLTHLHQQGFVDIEFEHKPEVMQFERLSDLTASLKSLGAQNANRGRATGLTGRKKIQVFKQAYEKFRRKNLLPATYDVFYLKAKT